VRCYINLSPFFSDGVVMRNEDVSKFNVSNDREKRTCDGIVFDSVMEMRFYRDVIQPKVGSGDIIHYELQKEYELQPEFTNRYGKRVRPVTYVADFYVEYADGSIQVIDTKGCADSTAKIKRKLFWYRYPELDYKWICYSKCDGGWVDYEYVTQQRRLRKKQKETLRKEKEKQNGNEE